MLCLEYVGVFPAVFLRILTRVSVAGIVFQDKHLYSERLGGILHELGYYRVCL